MTRGHWATHEYERRAVSRDVDKFEGWEKIIRLCLMLNSFRDRALYAITFLSAGRIGEVIRLRKNNFMIERDSIIVQNMLLLKRYNKEYGYLEYRPGLPDDSTRKLWTYDPKSNQWFRTRYETEKKTVYRPDFDIPRHEPMTDLMLRWLELTHDYLFPGYATDKRFPEHNKRHIHRVTAYKILDKIGIYPHWLRSQRASCLKSFYNLRDEDAMEWAGWEDSDTFAMYARMGRVEISKHMMRAPPREALELDRQLMETSDIAVIQP